MTEEAIHIIAHEMCFQVSAFQTLLKKAESFAWATMEPGVFEAAVSWLPGHYDARQVLLDGQSTKAPLLRSV